MCNGDLGMYRVMPWAYPTIPGQSSGGTSVDPTPEPSKECFDFSGATVSLQRTATIEKKGDSWWRVKFPVFVSGINQKDLTSVSSTKVIPNMGNFSISPDGLDKDFNINGHSNVDLNVSGYIYCDYYADPGASTAQLSGSGSITFEVHASDGKLLQSAEVTVT